MKLVFLNIRVKDGCTLLSEAEDLRKDGNSIELFESDCDSLDGDPGMMSEMLGFLASSDIAILRVSGDTYTFKHYPEFIETVEEHEIPLMVVFNVPERSAPYRKYFTGDDGDYNFLLDYLTLGGHANNSGILKWCLDRFDGKDYPVPEPSRPLMQGIHYPGWDPADIDGYIDRLDRSRPVIGIIMGQRKWNAGNTWAVDRLIKAVEGRGASALPMFMYYSRMEDSGSIGIAAMIDRYLLRDGESVVDSVINTITSSITVEAKNRAEDPNDPFLERLGVPVLMAPTLVSTEEEWRESGAGLTNAEISYDVAFPEFDGQVITVPFASTYKQSNGQIRYEAIESRVDSLADMAYKWAVLRHIPNSEKKVGILLYNYPPKAAHAGGAADLDTWQSVRDMLARMKEEGYRVDWVPEDGKALVDRIFEGITNDTDWYSDEEVVKRAADMITRSEYEAWFRELSPGQQDFIIRNWGEPVGNVLTVGDSIAVPGFIDGNVSVSFQPTRGADVAATYHNHESSIPHQYLSFYKWLRYDFKADAVIHIGTHGTLEWLPGKGVGLSEDCSPDYVLSGLPNLYPYIICNPGEGAQAKRRSYAVLVDHMIPAMVRAGDYKEVEELESVLQTYMNTVNNNQDEQVAAVTLDLFETVRRMNLQSDMGLPDDCTPEQVAELSDDLYDYVLEFKGNIIKDGLHIFGTVPGKERMDEMIYSLLRLRNGDIPSLPGSIARCMGFDWDELNGNASRFHTDGRLYGQIVDEVEGRTFGFIGRMTDAGCDRDVCLRIAQSEFPEDDGSISEIVSFLCDGLYPNINRITEEMDGLMEGLDGQYVRPGPSGCPTRGRADLLPTGRNFYTVDPEAIPTPASWELGKRMADQLVRRYLDEKGLYPDSIAITLWATDTMKTGGDDVAYALSLLGVKPVWAGYGNKVINLEVQTIAEMGHPRVDVTLNISGLFRDTFPNITEIIEDAIQRVSELDEKDEDNAVRAHIREDTLKLMESGVPEDEARRQSMFRIFSSCPGQYGMGANKLVETSAWKERSELGEYYIEVGGYAYGKGVYGLKAPEAYKSRLSRAKVTVKNSTSREYDMFDNDDVFQYLGGMNSAVEYANGGTMPMSVIGCSADTDKPVLRTIQEESKFIFRSKVLNPKYEQGLRRHGFRGATEILKMFEYIYGWDATSDIVEKWMYDEMANHYILDEDVRDWIEKANPFALHDMIDTLMEAYDRGMWDADDDMLEKLKRIYMDNEERLEEATDSKAVR